MHRRRELGTIVLGTVLLVAYVVQASVRLEWAWLAHQQTRDAYKVATGIVLASYLYVQWRGVRRRSNSR